MTMPPCRFHRISTVLFICALLAVPGCSRTLVFAEHDGVNLAVRADPSSSPPFEVNLGLKRFVGTIVPPAAQAQDNNRAEGQAVSMFAGFQVEREGAVAPSAGPNVNIHIATQFASGEAARNVADAPEVVATIVNVQPAVNVLVRARDMLIDRIIAFVAPDGSTAARDRMALIATNVEGIRPGLRQQLAANATSPTTLRSWLRPIPVPVLERITAKIP